MIKCENHRPLAFPNRPTSLLDLGRTEVNGSVSLVLTSGAQFNRRHEESSTKKTLRASLSSLACGLSSKLSLPGI